jgi:hypothetical protein
MKLSLAVAILSQTPPVVVSETNRRSNGRFLEGKIHRSRPRNQQKVVPALLGRSDDPRVIRRKGSSSNLVNALSAAGSPSDVGAPRICDPSSVDPDVGILSCGGEAKCERDVGSVLGGFCVPFPSSSSSSSSLSSTTLRHDENQVREAIKSKKLANKKEAKTVTSRKLMNSSSQRREVDLCDPLSSDPDIGILSCGTRRQCQPNRDSSLGGKCQDLSTTTRPTSLQIIRGSKTTARGPRTKAIECVPTKEAAIGGLECGGTGQMVCVESVESSRGGLCTSPTTSSRHLQMDFYVGFCDPLSPLYGLFNCDCSAFNNSTKTGVVPCIIDAGTCLGSIYYGCHDTCRTETTTYTYQNGELSSLEQCYEFVAGGDAATSSTLCITMSPDYTSCDGELNGKACSSCEITSYVQFGVDCTNVVEGMVVWPGVDLTNLPIIQACYKPGGEYCGLCSSGSSISYFDMTPISMDGFGDSLTCSGLADANTNNQIPAGKCSEATALAEAKCCAYQW